MARSQEVTAEGVKYSLERQKSKGMPQARMFDDIVKVETRDKYTVKLTLKETSAPFLNSISSPYPTVVAREAVEKYGELKLEMIGTGPFVLSEYTRAVSLVYQKNPDYFVAGHPYMTGGTRAKSP